MDSQKLQPSKKIGKNLVPMLYESRVRIHNSRSKRWT